MFCTSFSYMTNFALGDNKDKAEVGWPVVFGEIGNWKDNFTLTVLSKLVVMVGGQLYKWPLPKI